MRPHKNRLTDSLAPARGGPHRDLAAVRESMHRMIGETESRDHFVLLIAGYPHRTIEQTRFVGDCCREVGAETIAPVKEI